MKNGFENWVEVKRQTAQDGTQRVIYAVGNHNVIVTDADYLPGGLDIRVRAMTITRYTPEIMVDRTALEDKFQQVRIQTTSWGSLEVSEIDKVIAAYKEAQELAHEIERAFPQCFGETGGEDDDA